MAANCVEQEDQQICQISPNSERTGGQQGYLWQTPARIAAGGAACQGDKEQAREWLAKAKTKFDEMEIRERDFEVRELEGKLRG